MLWVFKFEVYDFYFSFLLQGVPNLASGAVSSGSLDFLRNSPQVLSPSPSLHIQTDTTRHVLPASENLFFLISVPSFASYGAS